MMRASGSLLIGTLLAPLAATSAHAQQPSARDTAEEVQPAATSLEVTRLLANTTSAVVATSAATTAAWGGYDAGAHTPVATFGTEVRVVPRLALVAAVAYGNAHASDAGFRPQLGLRGQIFRQSASGVDVSATVLFREDRFTSEDGLFEGGVAVGRSFGETSLVLNVFYGQDGEGDDHEGEVRLAGVRRVWRGLHVGGEARYMHSIDSTDPNRVALGTPTMEALAGPLVAYMVGSWAFLGEAGVSVRETSRYDTGVATLAGVGTAF